MRGRRGGRTVGDLVSTGLPVGLLRIEGGGAVPETSSVRVSSSCVHGRPTRTQVSLNYTRRFEEERDTKTKTSFAKRSPF